MKQIVFLFIIGSFAFIISAQGQANSSNKTQVKSKADGKFPKPGEWPTFRRSGTQEAHSPLRGNITQPVIAWKQFAGALESLVVVERGDANNQISLSGEEAKAAPADSITLSDFIPTPKAPDEDNNMHSVSSTYADILPEYPGKEKLEFESAFDKPMTNGQIPWTYLAYYN
ncbi:MAG TPA: hypothetical protein VK658_10795 [Chryseolinea sp.]|nr:hypothetical protein [Chryseolinea sp.]